jgi:hypothetical protein
MPDPGFLLTITVTRTGGIAGMRRQWTVTASSDEDVESWRPLVEACPWPGDAPTDDADRDRYVYRITAEDEGAPREATLPESAVTGPWRELVEQVRNARDPQE